MRAVQSPSETHRRFSFRHTLGRGGFGEVYLAEMTAPSGLTSTVAVKVLHGGLDPRSQAVQRLKDEARILSLLNHPSIVGVHDLAILDDRIAMVTEFVEGADLPDCLDGAEPMPIGAVLEVWAQVAGALDAAHHATDGSGKALGLLHRDVKPRNVRVGKHGQVKLLDFGIATGTGFDRDANTQTGALVGSFPYVAPERFRRGTPATPASDVYSLGCGLAECLPRHPRELVFESSDVAGFVALKVDRSQHDARIAEFLAGLLDQPVGLHALIRSLLAYDPDARPTCAEALARLEDLAAEAGGARLARWARGRSWPDITIETGGLTGQTVTETTASMPADTSQIDLLDVTTEYRDEARAPAPVTPSVPRSPDGDLPRPAAPPEPAGRGFATLALGALTVGGMGGIAAIALVVLIGTIGVGWLLVQPDAARPPEPVPTTLETAPKPGTPEPGTPEPGTPEPGTPEPGAPEPGTPDPSAVDPVEPQPVAPDPGAPQPTEPGPVATNTVPSPNPAPAGATNERPCGDLAPLETAANAGTLSGNQKACLGLAARNTGAALTQRREHARVLLVDAQKRCKNTPDRCTDYEREQVYYLEELGQYDPEMMLGWARYNYGKRRFDVTRVWVERALERRTEWGAGLSYLQRMENARELDALAAQELWKADTRDEGRRLATRDAAIEWGLVLAQRKKNTAPARDLCLAATGGGDVCDARLPDAAARGRVTLASNPAGLEVRVDGASVGRTPLTQELAFGEHRVEVTGANGTGSQTIQVGVGSPNHWTWTADTDGWNGVVR